MSDTETVVQVGDWKLNKIYNAETNITILWVHEGCEGIGMQFEQNHYLGGFKDNKAVYNELRIHISSYGFISIDGFNEFIEKQIEARVFAEKAKKYAEDNGFWID